MKSAHLDFDKLADDFWREGYIHLPGFFPSDLMDTLNVLIHDHFGKNPEFEHTDEFVSKASTEVVPWFPQREGVKQFDLIENDQAFNGLTRAILGEVWSTLYSMVMFSKAGTVGQAWHQDCPPENAYFNLNRLIYTEDIRPEIGGEVVVMPRSHNFGELSVGDPHEAMKGEFVIAPRKGDLLLLHGFCWHRVLPIKQGHRYSTNFRAGNRGASEEITDVCVYRNMRYRFSTSEVIVDRTAI